MNDKNFFKKINFNKTWEEEDWEKYFQAHEAYRLTKRNAEIRKKQMPRVKFSHRDDVEAFTPILKEYGIESTPSILQQLNSATFMGDEDPDQEYTPATSEDPHFWGEGAPLASLPIYRDCCRFAITTAKEIERYLKKKNEDFKNQYKTQYENLRFHANWVAINVAQGHQIGYSNDRIKGNVAKCRRAIKHIDRCIALINQTSLRTKSLRLRENLFSFAVQLRLVLFMWIDELRDRID